MDVALKLASFETVPADSAIYVEGEKVEKALFGIDAGVSELLLAKHLGCDAVISHHPKGGTAVVGFHKVFSRHVPQMVAAGVPRHEAESAVQKKIMSLEVEMHARNYGHEVDVARLLKMPFMNIHTPLDQLGRVIMMQKIGDGTKENATVKEVVATLEALPEFQNAKTAIKISLGAPLNPAGKIIVSHGAGTNGGYEIAKTYFKHGVGTLIYIHISPVDLEKLKADKVGNLLVTGHVASDSIGINPFIEALENRGVSVVRVGVIPQRAPGVKHV